MTQTNEIQIQVVKKQSLRPEQLKGFFVGWPNPPSLQKHLEILESSYLSVVAIDLKTNQVVGFINCLSDGVLTCYIPLLEVLPAYQGKGLGRKLVQTLVDQVKDFYMVDVICDKGVLPFYQNQGFQESSAAIRRNYESQGGL